MTQQQRHRLFLALLAAATIASLSADVSQWTLESQHPPESYYPKIAVVGKDAYFFSDGSPTVSSVNSLPMDRFWRLNTETLEWSTGSISGQLIRTREDYCLVTIGQHIFMFGGESTSSGLDGDLFRFDIDTLSWTSLTITGQSPSSRSMHSCFTWKNKLYVHGGLTSSSILTDMWEFDPELSVWVKVQYENYAPLLLFSLGTVAGDKFYFFDGQWSYDYFKGLSLWSFDLVSKIWTREFFDSYSEPTYYNNIAIWKNTLFSFGGVSRWSEDPTNNLKVLDLDTMELILDKDYSSFWSPLQYPIERPSARKHPFTFEANDRIFIFGGNGWNGLNDFWVLDPVSLQWIDSSLSRYPIAREDSRIVKLSENEFAMFGGTIYVHGYYQYINDLWIFNTDSQKWTRVSQEVECSTIDTSCMPSAYLPSVGHWNNTVFVIGGASESMRDILPIARVFTLTERKWSSLDLDQAYLNTAGMLYVSQFASSGSKLFIWGGSGVDSSVVTRRLTILDMQKLITSVIGPSTGWPSARYGGSGFMWNSVFCIYGGFVVTFGTTSSEIWCYDSGVWKQKANLAGGKSLASILGTVEMHGTPFAIGGDAFYNSGYFSNILQDGDWYPLTSRNYWPVGQLYISSTKIGSRIYVFGGYDFYSEIRTSMTYSFDLVNTFCSPFTTISNSRGLISDGSGKLRYLPSTKCEWEFLNVNSIQVAAIGLLAGARLTIEVTEECDARLIMGEEQFDKVEIINQHSGKTVFSPSGRFRVRFEVEDDAEMGEGFEFECNSCNLGFTANGTSCFCATTSFVNFRGECIPCPANTQQSKDDETKCVASDLSDSTSQPDHDEISKIEAIQPGQVQRMSSGPPPLLGAAAAEVDGIIYISGGKVGDGADVDDFAPMDVLFSMSSAVQTEWSSIKVNGEIPAARHNHCFLGFSEYGIVFGGDTLVPDEFLYVFYPSKKVWERKGRVPFSRSGAVCTAWNDGILVYGGQDRNGAVHNDLWHYNHATNQWSLLSQSKDNPAIAHAAGVIVEDAFVVFSGTDGFVEHNAVHIFHLDSTNVTKIESVELHLDDCLECDEDGGSCFFGRQSFSLGAVGGELHVYGGLSRGSTLHDILVFSLDSRRIRMRFNYEWEIPSLPIQYPPPKAGSAFASIGESLVIIGGRASADFASSDSWTWNMGLGTWSDSSIVSAPIQRGSAALIKTEERRFVMFGGWTLISEEVLLNDLWEYDIDVMKWTRLHRESDALDCPSPRAEAVIAYMNATLYVMGGRTYLGESDSTIWMFSQDTLTWTSKVLENMGRNFRPLQRVGVGHIQLGDRVVVFGGQLSSGLRGLERYTPILSFTSNMTSADRKAPSGGIPENRRHACVAAVDHHVIFVLGGESFDGRLLRDGWRLDTSSMLWSPISGDSISAISGGISHCAAASYEETSVIHGGYSSSEVSSASYMVQHAFNATAKLYVDAYPGFSGFVEHSALSFDDKIILFGGSSNFALSNSIYAYRPAFCSKQGWFVKSSFAAAILDDGSAQANYLENTDCLWIIPNATHLAVSHELRDNDKIQIFKFTGSIATQGTMILGAGGVNNNQSFLHSETGFIVRLHAHDAENLLSRPCVGCKGFRIIHAACPQASDLVDGRCVCRAAHYLDQEMCLPCTAETIHPSCPLVLPAESAQSQDEQPTIIGASAGGAAGIAALVAFTFFYRHYREKVSTFRKKLYAEIDYQDIEFGELLGAGGYGEVFKGQWRGTEVAIKKLIYKKMRPKVLSAFMAEVAVMVELRHPNIVLYMGASLNPPNLCLVCELMVGNLFDLLQNTDVPITMNQRIRFMLDIAKGMQYLHSSNPPIIHRDLKSLNVLLDERWHAKVSDFGLTIAQGEQQAEDNAGSLLWLAPEVILGGEYRDYSDVYSFGIIIWEVMSRRVPFEGAESSVGVAMQVSLEGLRPSTEGIGIPQTIVDIMQKCWAQDPKNRPTFTQVVKDIQGLRELSGSNSSSFASFRREMDADQKWPTGEVCFVVTQLSGSEELWDEMPEAIADALHIHNDLMRTILRVQHGILVRNEGDSYMGVFQNVADGVKYALMMQEKLAEANWADSLLGHHQCSIDGLKDLRGPRFKMAIHYGKSGQQYDANDQPQYVGKVVNDTIRLCRKLIGGSTVLTFEAHESLVGGAEDVSQWLMANYDLNTTESTRSDHWQITSVRLKGRLSLNPQVHMKDTLSPNTPLTIDAEKSTNAKLESPPISLAVPLNHKLPPCKPTDAPTTETKDNHADLVQSGPEMENMNDEDARLDIGKRKNWEVDWSEVHVSDNRIGTGSFGTVFSGEYQGKKVAIKKMLQQTTRDRYYIAFLSELSMTRKLSHKNVVGFVGACLKTPNLSILTDLIDPGNLKMLLRDERVKFPVDVKKRIIKGVVEGMEYLHSQHPIIIHRDLKTSNILVDRDFNPYLCDFGFARIKVQNQTMTKCGTVAYQAPEILEGKRYTEKADVYSFGIVVWEIESRKTPYEAQDAVNVSVAVVKGTRPAIPTGVDLKTKELIQRCWNANADERPSFASLKEELQ
eukprot:TRINITY_DN1721_c0_g1_i7.p1 TRINITY_DN1721_c0_g1~~TRINITY_DN1721_c0_g1_i7.p1  ORF type:complete len:2527 (+),score=479.25 TRINITY_DN1721_c0_g1_i7:47-7627(+)